MLAMTAVGSVYGYFRITGGADAGPLKILEGINETTQHSVAAYLRSRRS